MSALQTKQNELAESQKNKDAKIAELTQQRDQNAKAQQEAKQQAEAVKAENDKLSASSAQQQTEKAQLASQLSALQTQHNELKENKKLTDEKLASGEMANSNSLLKIETQVTEISKLIAERDYLSDKNNDLESCIAELDSEVIKLEAQIELVNKVFIQD